MKGRNFGTEYSYYQGNLLQSTVLVKDSFDRTRSDYKQSAQLCITTNQGLYCTIVAYKMGITFILPPHFFARYRERVIQDDSLSTSKENVHALCSNPHFRPILWNSPARLLNLYPVSSSEQYSMKKEEKINYEAPATIVIDVRTEGFICQSNGLNPMGDPEDL